MDDHIRLDENVLFRRVAGEGVVVDQRAAQVMVVNDIGIRVLELIRELGSVEKIVNTIATEYDADVTVIEADVNKFLGQINEHKMTVNT